MSKYLIISLHDFHPTSHEVIAAQIRFCSDIGAHVFSILAVPHFHNERKLEEDGDAISFLDERSRQGDDIVLHGYYHDRHDREGGSFFFTKLYTANESEFLDLPDNQVKERILKASTLWKQKGWDRSGFIAPAWLFPNQQDALLRELGFTYTTRLRGIHRLSDGQFTPSQSLCYSTRSTWRVNCSLMWNSYLFGRLRGGDVIRLSLHPNDLRFVPIRKQIATIIETALADGYQPVSYKRYVEM